MTYLQPQLEKSYLDRVLELNEGFMRVLATPGLNPRTKLGLLREIGEVEDKLIAKIEEGNLRAGKKEKVG